MNPHVCVCVYVYVQTEKVEREFYLHKSAQTDSEAHLAPIGYVPKAGHAPLTGVGVKNERSYTSMLSRLYGVCMSNITFVAAPAAPIIRCSSEHALLCSCCHVRKDLVEAVPSGNLRFTIIWNAIMFLENICLIT